MEDEFRLTAYCNGYVSRQSGGGYGGEITIDGVHLGEISAVYFREEGNTYLWLRRKKKLEYIIESQRFVSKEQTPKWETYMEKVVGRPYAYVGTFMFLRFKYRIYGVWDRNGDDGKERLNLFVDRMDMSEQDIIMRINKNNNERR